jgi:hypothetical protein
VCAGIRSQQGGASQEEGRESVVSRPAVIQNGTVNRNYNQVMGREAKEHRYIK